MSILGHKSSSSPPLVHGTLGLYLHLPAGAPGAGREPGGTGRDGGLREPRGAGEGLGTGPGQWREESLSWVTARKGSPWLRVVVSVKNVLKPASPSTFIQNRWTCISPAWLQDQPGTQGASTPLEPRVINRRRPGKQRLPWSPRSQRPAGSLRKWGAARRRAVGVGGCRMAWGKGPPGCAPSARILSADRRFK